MSQKTCENCVFFDPDNISQEDIDAYADQAEELFSKGDATRKYLESVKSHGGGRRSCSASRPFAYKDDQCDSIAQFVSTK